MMMSAKRAGYTVGGVAGILLICAGGTAAAIPALIIIAGLALFYHCTGQLLLLRRKTVAWQCKSCGSRCFSIDDLACPRGRSPCPLVPVTR